MSDCKLLLHAILSQSAGNEIPQNLVQNRRSIRYACAVFPWQQNHAHFVVAAQVFALFSLCRFVILSGSVALPLAPVYCCAFMFSLIFVSRR